MIKSLNHYKVYKFRTSPAFLIIILRVLTSVIRVWLFRLKCWLTGSLSHVGYLFSWISIYVCEKERKRKGGRSKVKPVSCAAVALLLQSATDLKADY